MHTPSTVCCCFVDHRHDRHVIAVKYKSLVPEDVGINKKTYTHSVKFEISDAQLMLSDKTGFPLTKKPMFLS